LEHKKTKEKKETETVNAILLYRRLWLDFRS
jgi:hypothetical protein